MTITLTINGVQQDVDAPPDMPLLWALRDILGLMGTKYGCGLGVCGACTIHLVTIEGLSPDGNHPLQQAWVAEDVPQCGYCQAGQIMSAAALLAQTSQPTDEQIDAALGGNICRCGTYLRIRKAVQRAAKAVSG
jgi:aerobic-type carbon monoxide dehydrogenase small subunit (CoxS/CutS family)